MAISVQRYIDGIYSIYEEQPEYQLGHDGSDGKCDCIGMPRGALKREGVKNITNLSGTNQAARHTILDLKPISSVKDLKKGAVVLKTRDKDDANMRLPDKYRKGGSDYSQQWGETNFTHIGTVTGLNPLEITHMTSPTAKKDTSLGNWKYSGWLPWVETEGPAEVPEEDGVEMEWATVMAQKGSSVKMRAKPSTSCRLYWDVPVGSDVIVEQRGGPWSKITWAGQTGYMMSEFLRFDDDPVSYTVTIRGLTKEQAEELCREWGGATMESG